NQNISVEATFRDGKSNSPYLTATGNDISSNSYLFDQNSFEYVTTGSLTADNNIAHILTEHFENRVYHFRAERFHVGQSNIGPNHILSPDAANLPEVLRNLKSGKSRTFNKYLTQVRNVFPEIKDININLVNERVGKIFLSSIDPEEERYDLDIPLQDSGTGIGQVLAILYVVVTSQFPQIIIIDEPQSFLHPGAVRKLFNILKQSFPQHQYIVTTHSPTVIASINPSNIIQLVLEKSITKPRQIDIKQKAEMHQVLSDVGASLSDVFGADNVLWVEGSTEESCFQEIIPAKCKNNLLGTAIASVLHTGDFESKKKNSAETYIRIYKRLSESTALIPPAIGFIFDREGRSEEEILELKKLGNIHFLKRRMYENYLLNAEIITDYV
ncbi:MAG: AAA family ATPase, partial [Chloroflexi bacterium]|nr:AAA family ATPase [Chloroflexota bacterium]